MGNVTSCTCSRVPQSSCALCLMGMILAAWAELGLGFSPSVWNIIIAGDLGVSAMQWSSMRYSCQSCVLLVRTTPLCPHAGQDDCM